MIWSVWNYKTRSFDYYRGGQATGTHAPASPKPLIEPRMGATPDEAAWRLPPGAVKVGAGAEAKGRIASLGDTGSSLSSLALPIGIGIAAYLLWRNR